MKLCKSLNNFKLFYTVILQNAIKYLRFRKTFITLLNLLNKSNPFDTSMWPMLSEKDFHTKIWPPLEAESTSRYSIYEKTLGRQHSDE